MTTTPCQLAARCLTGTLRPAARTLTGSAYVVLGSGVLLEPGPPAREAAALMAAIRDKVPLAATDGQVVRMNGAVQVACGALLALGRLPRLSALILAGSMVPTTLAAHRFWTVEDPVARKQQQIQFFKNAAMIGGLLFAALD